MTKDEALQLVKQALADEGIGYERYGEDTTMSALGMDSLDIVQMFMYLEETLGREVEDPSLNSIKTVGDMVKFVETLNK